MNTTTNTPVQLCLALLLLVLTTTLQARELRYAMGFPPGSDSDVAAQAYAKALSEYTDGELTVKIYPLSLLNFAETSAGLRDGIAQVGYVLAPYFPAEFPHMNLLAESSMMLQLIGDKVRGREGMAYVGAMAEYLFLHCPECHQEFAAQKQVFTSNAGSTPYGLTCTQPVTNQAELKGKRLRVAGSHWSRWAQHFGATPITMSSNEALEALNQGVVDCVIISAPELTNLGLIDAVTDITMAVPGGIFAGTGTTNVNLEVWRSLSEHERRAMIRAGAVMAAQIPYIYHQRQDDVLAKARDEYDARIHDASPELVAATRDFVREDLNTIVDYYKDKHGVERGQEMLDEFLPILERWVDLVQDIDSAEALAELYWKEAYSKVDVSRYGL
ncbi:TRAP transporter substrate-binding protein [Alcanivorax xiamenensis]|uniref:TRAP transporter substrate-binding protein n=1 Tax=Alcanivorax xiamenensis TaxID=1177156 RepID=A0ABQ6Y3T3_9GAMM|nr:C4-dicarboxylate TRAP transporter substrate-binding protein [Alcanivorax xiamenensis]KAF0803202.1 TRAP transporter substrate-binding protein [Alcanivorax xiamenensis]